MAHEPEEITLTLPVPPALNEMIKLAKKRTRKTKRGHWLKKAAPIVYDEEKHAFEIVCGVYAKDQGVRPPVVPWEAWELVDAHFEVHNERDWTELAAGLKWVVDFFVNHKFVKNDSPREMKRPERWPTQKINRRDPSVRVTIRKLDNLPR